MRWAGVYAAAASRDVKVSELKAMSLWEWAAWSRGWDAARTGEEEPGGPLTADQRAEAEALLDSVS